MNKLIFRTQFGSHVYGTNVPESDLDYKSIFIPSAHSLVLQTAKKHSEHNTKADTTARNTKDDIDDESFSIQHFCKLLCEGQTVALDMIFTPIKFWQPVEAGYNNTTWYALQKNKDKFLHKGTSSFVGYTKTQAAKYGVKGFRVAALRETIEFLKSLDGSKKLSAQEKQFLDFIYSDKTQSADDKKLINLTSDFNPNSGEFTRFLEVCNKKVNLNCTAKYALSIFQRMYDEYGHRALLAEKNEGIDWKALMHAVRVAREAEELLLTGNITFPRPEKDLLLQIRKGELDYNKVAPIIEEGLIRIEEAQKKSTLSQKPNFEWVEHFVLGQHLAEIFEEYE